VSNFDVSGMEKLESIVGGVRAATDQVLYNLMRRGIEYDLLPWCRRRSIPVMAYSPIEQGNVLLDIDLQRIGQRDRATPAQVALAWVLRQGGTIAIPRAGDPRHVLENRVALDLRLTNQDLATLDRVFPPPSAPQPLAMI
jgi:diketogulonate reductase-like aldo/keto reductase